MSHIQNVTFTRFINHSIAHSMIVWRSDETAWDGAERLLDPFYDPMSIVWIVWNYDEMKEIKSSYST